MPTLLQYRQAAAPQVHPFFASTATGGSTQSILEIARWPYLSSNSQDDLFADYFILRPDATAAADRVRTVLTYVSSTGKFIPDSIWTNAPASGEAVELHGILEPGTELLRLVNETLKRTFVVVEFALSATGDVKRQWLNRGQSWLTEPKWVRQVGFLDASADRAQTDPYSYPVRGEVEKLGDQVWLQHDGQGFNSGDRIYVKAIKPAYDHCRAANGTYGEQAGLSAETDETIPQVDWVAAGVRRTAWDEWNQMLAPGDEARTKRERADAAALFGDMTQRYLDVPEYSARPLMHWGPAAGAYRRSGLWV